MAQDSLNVEPQEEIASRVYFVEPSLKLLVPQGNFSRQINRPILYGGSVAMFYQLKPARPAFVGLEVGYSQVDRYSLFWTGFFDNGDPAEFDATATTGIFDCTLVGRYYPGLGLGNLELYVEGGFGFRWMSTAQEITSFFMGVEEDNDFDFVEGDIGLLYSAAVGLQYALGPATYLNTKVGYMATGSLEYLSLPEGGPQGGFALPIDAFEEQRSATNAVRIDIGLTFVF